MNKPIKKIIAREGIVLVIAATISLILVWVSVPTGHHYEYFSTIGLGNPYPFFDNRISASLYAIGVRLAFVYYPGYLVIRGIFWAIRTLRER